MFDNPDNDFDFGMREHRGLLGLDLNDVTLTTLWRIEGRGMGTETETNTLKDDDDTLGVYVYPLKSSVRAILGKRCVLLLHSISFRPCFSGS